MGAGVMSSQRTKASALDALHAMMRDPRYWNAADPERERWIAKVTRGFDALYPDNSRHDFAGRPKDRAEHGVTVHVNEYIRTVSGEDVLVSEHERGWPSGSGHAQSQGYTPGNGVPKAPPGVDIDKNIKEAENHWAHTVVGDLWFYDQVKSYGPWDYKRISREYEGFGNFHYGAVGAAMGYSLDTLQRTAGWYQVTQGTSDPSWGGVAPSVLEAILGIGGVAPFGDDPVDYDNIGKGYSYYVGKYVRKK